LGDFPLAAGGQGQPDDPAVDVVAATLKVTGGLGVLVTLLSPAAMARSVSASDQASTRRYGV
jgi:hypothetical protein